MNRNKPNFMVIDEGWGCLDNNNIEKIQNFLYNINKYYDFIIIVSHINKLKNIVNKNEVRNEYPNF